MDGLIVLRHIKVENANAIAGNTWGFPAIANFLGFTHALQRQLNEKSGKQPLTLLGCGIVCHHYQHLAHKTHEYGEFLFSLTRNPLDKNGNSPAFVEEGRMHMDVSLVIPWDGRVRGKESQQAVADLLKQIALRLRLAGGTILSIARTEVLELSDSKTEKAQDMRRLSRSLLPGFALVSRQDTLAEHQKRRKESSGPLAHYGCEDSDMQAWLEFSALSTSAKAEDNKVEWSFDRVPYGGWLRPIAVGYKAISDLYQPGEVANTRDKETPVRFVETLYSLGEWLSPHRIKTIEQLYWYYSQDEQNGYYQCINQYQPPVEADLTESA